MNSLLNITGHETRIPDIVRGEGAYVVDANGKTWLDLESGVWCLPLGHCHPRINAALIEQAGAMAHAGFCYSNGVVEAAARDVLSVVDFPDGQCLFLCSGSEVIELAGQIIRHLTGRTTTLCLHDAYFGSFGSTQNRSSGWYEFDWRECETCPHRNDCQPACDRLTSIPADISAFAFEPGSSSGFVRFPPESLVRNLVDAVRQRGGLILANEVTTGIGRTGAWFGHQHYSLSPDLICIGKGLGNGYPVSTLAINRETAGKLEAGTSGPFRYMQSHQNDPLGAAVARAVITELSDSQLVVRAAKLGEKLLNELRSIESSEHVVEVRGRGLMYAVEFTGKAVGDQVYDQLLDQGFIVCNRGGLFRIDPPLVIKESEFSAFVRVFHSVLEAL